MNEQLDTTPDRLYRKYKYGYALIASIENDLARVDSELIDVYTEWEELTRQGQAEESEEMQRVLKRIVIALKTRYILNAISPEAHETYRAALKESEEHYKANVGAYQEQALEEDRKRNQEIIGQE